MAHDDPYFRHLLQELFLGPCLEGMNLNWREKKDYNPKGPLTKTLLDILRKVIVVHEIPVKDSWSEHMHNDTNLSPEQYVGHLSLICYSVKRMVSDIYDRFLIVISIVTRIAEMNLLFVTAGNLQMPQICLALREWF
ncbi:hypothetical protein NPIL_293961 [Nephila pilipes]|uniref:Uncharacterized protein n=1 Tax=Nephila pilipes TaxID=299642 RepID=A0A8X6U4E6_NEPPI|nr:hypothetical protein NPIL_293961 [Nephila pilipes]